MSSACSSFRSHADRCQRPLQPRTHAVSAALQISDITRFTRRASRLLPSCRRPVPRTPTPGFDNAVTAGGGGWAMAVSYTHLRAHETPEHLVCRLLLEKKKKQ